MDAPRKLLDLLALPAENEVVEFKEAKSGYDFTKLGRYFSALSNEANLKRQRCAWLAMGVSDARKVVGTAYRVQRAELDQLKAAIADKTTGRISFIEIHEVAHEDGRVLLFEIPAAPKGMPMAFEGHFYGRDGEALGPLNLEEIERIRAQSVAEDWSAEIVAGASLSDLDEQALAVARTNFGSKFPDRAAELAQWDDLTFLNKAKLCIKGRITRAALLLLGREEAEHFLLPADPKLRWILKGRDGQDLDYETFGMPLLLAVDRVYARIRKLKYRYIREGTLFPEEVDQYEPYAIREALNNCIAHQDYRLAGRINVVEREDSLCFTNKGSFVPGSVQRVVMEDAPEEHYRNRFLATAMFNLKMVDTAGGGIRRMFLLQRQRFFPLPDYDLSGERVQLTLTGKLLDLDYARQLARDAGLGLAEIMALDKVQKRQALEPAEEQLLRAKGLIEGRKPNFFVAKSLAQQTGQKARYINNRGLDKQYYLDLIYRAVQAHGSLTRRDIDELLWKKLPDWMADRQRKIKVSNLIAELRQQGRIVNRGSDTRPVWSLMAPPDNESQ